MWTAEVQVEQDQDGGGGSRQRWMESSDLWPMLHWKRQGISRLKSLTDAWGHHPTKFLFCKKHILGQIDQLFS